MITLVHKEEFPNASLYAVVQGRRVKFAECLWRVETYEKQSQVALLGHSAAIRKTKVKKGICATPEFTRDFSDDFLSQVSRFEVIYDEQGENGIFERKMMDIMTLLEINSCNEFIFELE